MTIQRGIQILSVVLALHSGSAAERQDHGLIFESWVRETFFDGYVPEDPTQKWDIPASVNLEHGGIPVNPKAIQYQSSVDLGDALRQFDIQEPFWLVVGFWQAFGKHKRMVNITPIRVSPENWSRLWGKITRADLEKLDGVIKDRDLDYREARKQAHALNDGPPFSKAVIRLHPKIDSHGQRRLQCSLGFSDLFENLAPEADAGMQERPGLWGVPFPALLE